MRVFAYRATAAGIARRQQERGQPIAAIEAVETPPAPVAVPVASNVVPFTPPRLIPEASRIPRTEAQQIIADVAHKHGLSYADMLGPERWRHFVAARHEAIAAVKAAKPMMTLPQLGRLFRRDFSTIAHALRKRGE